MAYYDRHRIEEFPYNGTFYRIGIDETLPPSQQVEGEMPLLDTKCNVQEAGSNLSGDFINASYKIYFPYVNDGVSEFPFKKNDSFKAVVNGLDVSGKVIGIFPSQLQKAYVYIKDFDV